MLWVPSPKNLCILWHVGDIAHRERLYVGRFLQGCRQEDIILREYEVFGPQWRSVEDVQRSTTSVAGVIEWVRSVREDSRRYITSLDEADFGAVPPSSEEGLSMAHWLFITVAHGALHIGRI